MDFIDEVFFRVRGGKGGDGCVSFRREKYVPKGGPNGGDGGNGGSIILKVGLNLNTLTHLKQKKRFLAGNGEPGKGKKKNGKKGKNVIIHVPSGTLVKNEDNQQCLGDLTDVDDELIIARGGKGGRGNTHFATSSLQAPDFAEKGTPGENCFVGLELKLLADVGLVGLPNVGKSTLLSVVSKARPKIADYPFTTLAPNLGIVSIDDYQTFVLADIPGLIQGAHRGKGLGDRFLRHIERTSVLVFVIESISPDPEKDFQILLQEIELYKSSSLDKFRIVLLSKIDLLSPEIRADLPHQICGEKCYPVSSVTREGIPEFLRAVTTQLKEFTIG